MDCTLIWDCQGRDHVYDIGTANGKEESIRGREKVDGPHQGGGLRQASAKEP